jgi:O-antigen/teichoic acid export membrane protein
MKPTTRIAANAAATYMRSVLAVGLSLFSSRWVLKALGTTDFGLFNIVGSLIIFLTFLNSVMATSSARHFAYAMGKRNIQEVNKWFNASLSIHLILPAFLVAIGWPLAECVIRNILTIPPDRIPACIFVFRISLFSAFVNMASIPFVAMFTAKQEIAEIAFWGVFQAILNFMLAWILPMVAYDKLIFYAAGMVLIHIIIHLMKIYRAYHRFPECQISLRDWFNLDRFKELLSFATWTLIGRSGGTLRNQGSSILLNLYFGPSVNAGFGIANQVSIQTGALSAAMMGAISPEITRREGSGERKAMIDLAIRSCKYGTVLVLLLAIPFLIEANYILKLWLVNPPPYSVVLSQLIMITFLVDKITAGYMYAVNAHGKIMAYQSTVGVMLLLTLPISWLLLKIGLAPPSIGFAFIFVQAICSIGRVVWAKKLFGVSVIDWVKKVLLPCFVTSLISIIIGYSLITAFPPGIYRLFLVCLSSFITIFILSIYIILDKKEVDGLMQISKAVCTKILSFANC